MRKVIVLVIAITMSLSSCTDSSENVIENTENYENISLIDKDDIQEPDDRND